MRPKVNNEKKKFGLLTVLECIIASDGKNDGGIWLCKCKCGSTISLSGYRLHGRNSCGCLGRKAAKKRGEGNKKPLEEKEITKFYQGYKRVTDTPLIREEWLKKIAIPCKYCKNTSLRIAIDVCDVCRTMCGKLTDDQFLAQIRKIVRQTDVK